jgi:predicted PurR-regulated permease PerM
MRGDDLWERLTVPMAYLIAGLSTAGAFWLFGWWGILVAIGVGIAYQIWWRWRHGRWMRDADWM